MEERKTKANIWEGKKKAFLVCDESLKDCNAPFLEFLRTEGYTCSGKGNYGCWWVHVDITTKQYAYGMPGVALVGEIGNHAITIDEFMTIYNIYKKYEGKELFVFHKNRFDYDRTASHSPTTKNNRKTYNKIADVVQEIDTNSKEVCLSLGVIDYDAPYSLHYNVSLHFSGFFDAKVKVYDFLSRIDMLQTITIFEQN